MIIIVIVIPSSEDRNIILNPQYIDYNSKRVIPPSAEGMYMYIYIYI